MHTVTACHGHHLQRSQVEIVGVEEQLWLVVELRSELFDITAAVKAVVPGGRNVGEQAISMVKAPALQAAVHGRERLHADQIEQHCAYSMTTAWWSTAVPWQQDLAQVLGCAAQKLLSQVSSSACT